MRGSKRGTKDHGWIGACGLAAALIGATTACSDAGDDDDLYGDGGSGATGLAGGVSSLGGSSSGGTVGGGGTSATGGTVSGGGTSATGGTVSGGGTGATGATGGNSAGGHSGNPMCPTQPSHTDPFIEGLEDGNDSLPLIDGRSGFWYTLNDGSDGVQTPSPGQGNFLPIGPGEGAIGTDYAAHTEGSGFTGIAGTPSGQAFARMCMPLFQVAGNYCAYDASAYSGISFYAKGSVPVRFLVATSATTSTAQGGTCGVFCGNHFFARVDLTSDWQLHTITWDRLEQDTWSDPVDFDAGALLELQWAVLGTIATTGFDFTVDEIAFTGG